MMPLSSHLRLEVFVRVNGGINLRHILFILPPAVFWRLVAPAIQLVASGPVLFQGGAHTRVDHAARRISAKLSLSLAFMFSGTLPSNQSRTALLHENRIPCSPPSTTLFEQYRWWRCGESNPGLSVFIVDCQQLIFYIYNVLA